LLPKLSGSATQYLNGQGDWAAPAGTGSLLAANNLSDLANVTTARTNLGLGTAATTAVGAYATAAQGATADAAVPKSLYDANSILIATIDNAPAALTVAASRIVGRKATGDIVALTGAEAGALTKLDEHAAPTDVTTLNASTTAHGLLPKLSNVASQFLGGTGVWTDVWAAPQTINAQTGTTYTPVVGDTGQLTTLSNAAAITVTIPQDSALTWPIGMIRDYMQLGAGQVTVVAGTGATVHPSGLTNKARAQYARFSVQKIAANTFSLFGDLAAA
jgi:hypothetical protein